MDKIGTKPFFVTELLTVKRGAQLWELTDYLIFYSAKYHGYLQAPPGFVTNFGSIPRVFWTVFPPVDIYDPATVIHDAGYNNRLQTIMGNPVFTIKRVADDLFLEGMLALDVNKKKAKLMYDLVKQFGKPDGPIINTNSTRVQDNVAINVSLINYNIDSNSALSLC